MDRISAIRNVESALVAFETGEIALETLEERVTGVLRTYATEFEGEDHRAVYRVHGTERAHPLVIVAPSPGAARERARGIADLRPTDVERVSDPER
jgi:DNA-binding protein Fis